MAVFKSLSRVPDALSRNPVVFVPVAGYLLLQLPQFFAGSLSPGLQSGLSLVWSLLTVVLSPFYVGGLLSMADEALDGDTGAGSFVDGGRDHYVQLLIGYVLLIAVNGVIGFLVAILVVVAFVVVLGSGGLGNASAATLAVLGVVALLVALAYLALNFFIQFYSQAIVIDGDDAIPAFKRSVRLVRGNLAAAFGFVLLRGAIGLLGAAPLVAVSFTQTPALTGLVGLPRLSLPTLVAVAAVGLLLSTLASTVTATYGVSFYRAIRG